MCTGDILVTMYQGVFTEESVPGPAGVRARPPDRGHGGRPRLRGAGGPRPRHLQPLLSVQEQAEAPGLHLRRLGPGEQLQGDKAL